MAPMSPRPMMPMVLCFWSSVISWSSSFMVAKNRDFTMSKSQDDDVKESENGSGDRQNGNTAISGGPADGKSKSEPQKALSPTEKLAFSAPGKALIAGGYLVLEPIYDSYVTALSARTHALVSAVRKESGPSSIVVSSPQFVGGNWNYVVTDEIHEAEDKYNPFLESAITTVLDYASLDHKFDIEITIFSDPGFHTQEHTEVRGSDNGSKRFLYHSKDISKVPKTGLGSSASLTTVVVSCLISQLKETPVFEQIDRIHNLAQVAHCRAQRKIGSGFDVAAAVYGSIKYRRFAPEPVNEYLTTSEGSILHSLIDASWDFVHEPCSLPPGIRLLMGDIKGGSETPKLVSKILVWKKSKPEESEPLYDRLNKANLALIQAFTELHELHASDPEAYYKTLKYFKVRSVSSVQLYLQLNSKLEAQLGPFLKLVRAIQAIRKNLKTLTRLSGADVEPTSQTILLNQCTTLAGCLGGVVPGAGGYDAVCLLVVSDAVDSLVADARLKVPQVAWLDLQEEASGLREENPHDYIGL